MRVFSIVFIYYFFITHFIILYNSALRLIRLIKTKSIC